MSRGGAILINVGSGRDILGFGKTFRRRDVPPSQPLITDASSSSSQASGDATVRKPESEGSYSQRCAKPQARATESNRVWPDHQNLRSSLVNKKVIGGMDAAVQLPSSESFCATMSAGY
ncbi:uncharacterized protein CLUP02_16222 [Colletotrichum lupini]|uniref:Uncharacterized protein n=1 Tax=Colletotrichum lupini TaxID=145971 RepID=A0A9Q8T9I6_9PEZI|nr:uncharacterized protein CLUP02_16222 [Colletotrichum lupini]UQC90692.1 hypothetical protein CLUP02_16222 [Colletotrichum lupini]